MPVREIEPAFLERLGRIVTAWAVIEAMQTELLSKLIEANPGRIYIMTQGVSARTVTEWIRTLLPVCLTDVQTQERIADLLTEIGQAHAERNTLVHGIWSTNAEPETILVQTVRWERAEVVKGEVVTLADLDDLIGFLLQLRQQLRAVINIFV